MQLQERDAPLLSLRDGYSKACAGEGHCVILLGDAGIGKTALLRAFLDGLDATPRVLRGSCEDLAVAEPLGPLRDLAREAGWRLEDDLGEKGGRIAAFSEALASIDALEAPTLIVVEDLHWADDGTVDFLKFLTRRLDRRKLFIVATARSDDARGRANIRQMLSGVSPDRVCRIELKPLSLDAVKRLAVKGNVEAEMLFSVTAGNAFYVSEIIKSGLSSVPHSVEDAVLARLDSVEQGARTLAEAVSIFPRRAETGLLREMLRDDIDAATEECLLRGILEQDGEYLAFRHEIARLAVEASLSPTYRRRLHLACLKLLDTEGSVNAARRLHHAKQVEDVVTLRQLAPQAAEEAMQMGAVRAASDYFDLALRYAEPTSKLAHAELLEKAAWANYLVGTIPGSIELQAAALEIYREAGDTLREGDGYRKLSRFYWFTTKIAKAREMADKAVLVLAQHRGPEMAMALSNQSQLAMLDRSFSQVGAPAREAIAISREFGRPDIEAHALNNLGQSIWLNDAQAGRQMLKDSVAIAMKLGETDHVARGFTNWTFYEMELLNFEDAEAHAREGIAYCAEHELDGYRAYLSGALAWILLRRGKWAEASALMQGTFNLDASDVDDVQFFMSGRSFSGACAIIWLSARQGRPINEQVTRYLEAFMANADELQRNLVYSTLLAELAWLGLADEETALQELRRVVERAEDVALVADAALWLKRLDPAAVVGAIPAALRPVQLELEGDWNAAADVWASLGAPFDEAMALAQGDTEGRLRAIEIFGRLGATASAERVSLDLRREGIDFATPRPRASTLRNPMGLTNRQMDVLRALNDGLTNAEIGEKLFVSPKTVDHHVSAILARLEVGSRGEAAAKARKLDIL
jgi:DNA-binding CsgD family transcriptional regulator